MMKLLNDDDEKNGNFIASQSLNVRYMLYASHTFSTWGDRMWEFAVSLFLIELMPESVLLTSLYGFTETAAVVLFGGRVGLLVDTQPRLFLVRLALIVQNVSVAASAGALYFLLYRGNNHEHNGIFIICIICVLIAAATSMLASVASNIAIERDWVVIISNGDASILSNMNATMKGIDLVCKVLAPTVSGFFIYYTSILTGCVTILVWNLISIVIEYSLIFKVFTLEPRLALRIPSSPDDMADHVTLIHDCDSIGSQVSLRSKSLKMTSLSNTSNINSSDSLKTSLNNSDNESLYEPNDSLILGGNSSEEIKDQNISRRGFLCLFSRVQLYYNQDVALPGLAYSLLFCTVLSFGSVMTSFLKWRGMGEQLLGVLRGIAAFFGVTGVMLFSRMVKYFGLESTSLVSIWLQFVFIFLCLISVFFEDRIITMTLLVAGVILSRFGLWSYDISITQMFQTRVARVELGQVTGIHKALCNVFEMTGYALSMIIHHQYQFHWLIFISVVNVFIACVIQTIYVDRQK